jgi:endonuclease/exonuclease/phosphatase (EEP) superfamily protein YafD
MSEHFDTQGPGLIQGDFNVDTESLQAIFPTLFENGYKEVLQSEPTTPKHHRYDHVMYRSLELREYRTLSSVGTDHYPIVLTFETTGR